MKKQFNILIVLFFIPITIWANEIDLGSITKQKNIKKAYFVNNDAGIDITNSYGSVYVTTWNEDKIELDIVIKVSGDNENWVIKKLDEIDVSIEALKSLVTAQTNIAKTNYKNNWKNNSIEINYTIKIPKNGSVKIDNKYGEIITTDLFANTDLYCKYGKITLAKLNGSSNTIHIDYCSKSTIDYIKNGNINADYSGLTINEFSKINLQTDYTDLNFLTGNDLKYNCSYGKLLLGKINNLDGNGDYLSIKVNQIFNNLQIETSYSKIAIAEMDAKANNININSEYTAVEIGYDANYVFDFDINVKYADFKYESDLEIASKQVSNFNKSYQGYHKKSGQNKIDINSSYGKVSLNQKN